MFENCPKLIIYTDSSCDPLNNGNCSYGFVVTENEGDTPVMTGSGWIGEATSQDAEGIGVSLIVKKVCAAFPHRQFEVRFDSQDLENIMSGKLGFRHKRTRALINLINRAGSGHPIKFVAYPRETPLIQVAHHLAEIHDSGTDYLTIKIG